jgi:hypothetical protein
MADAAAQECRTHQSTTLVHADAHFRMGGAHEREGSPCQDYATSGTTLSGLPFAVVSDGCSSSGRTDLGARLLALSTARLLGMAQEVPDIDLLRRSVLSHARQVGLMLALRTADMEATLGVVAATQETGAVAMLFGDGVVAARTKDGFDVRIVEWAANMPGYPWYLASAAQTELFVEQSDAAALAEGRPACRVQSWLLDAEGQAVQTGERAMDARAGLQGVAFEWGEDSGLDSVAVMTDGALQVYGMQWPQTVLQMACFKTAREGAFVRRRMSRALAEMAKAGCRPADDVALAAVAAGQERV